MRRRFALGTAAQSVSVRALPSPHHARNCFWLASARLRQCSSCVRQHAVLEQAAGIVTITRQQSQMQGQPHLDGQGLGRRAGIHVKGH